MKILKKIVIWNNDYSVSENILLICYRVFTYLIPSGLIIWNLLIDKIFNKEITVMTKIGFGGVFALILLVLVAIYFLGRHFRKKINEVNDKLLDCVDIEKKKELLKQKKNLIKWQEIYHNAIFLSIFIVLLVVITLLEKGLLSMRGTLMIIVISMCSGFGFNTLAQNLISKNK